VPLVAPTRSFNKIPLAIVSIAPALLVRISNYDSGEPFFGRSASGRFDDYRSPAAKRFGTNYCGLSPDVAFAETVLHDEVPVRGRFQVSAAAIAKRFLVDYEGEAL